MGGHSHVGGIRGGLRPLRRAAAAVQGHGAARPRGGAGSDARRQPVQHVLVDVLPAGLVQNFVAQAVVELDAHILQPRLPEAGAGLLHALAHAAYRVPVSGDEEYRQVLVHFVDVGLLGDTRQAVQHIPEQPQGGVSAAERVGDIGVHIGLVGGHPVEAGAGGGERLVVRTEGQVVSHGAVGLFAQAPDLAVRYQLPAGNDRRGLMARAAKDAAAEKARIADEVRPGQERAHGVSEEEIGLVREDFGRAAAQLLDVVHYVPPAVLLAEIDHGGVLN